MNVIKRIQFPGWVLIFIVLLLITTKGYQSIEQRSAAAEQTIENKDLSVYPNLNPNGLTSHSSLYTLSVSIPIIHTENSKREEQAQKKTDSKIQEQIKKEYENDENTRQSDLDPDGKYIALTFDDGPSGEVTPRILDALNMYDAKATFFMLGSQVDYYPELALKVAEEGHEIANHTVNHADLTKLNGDGIGYEINNSRDKIANATGHNPTFVRPPYGAYNDSVKQIASQSGESIILWSVDSLDWQHRNSNELNRIVLENAVSGSIVLMHDIHSATADGLPSLLESLSSQGYEFVTVSELLKIQERNGVGPHHGNYGS